MTVNEGMLLELIDIQAASIRELKNFAWLLLGLGVAVVAVTFALTAKISSDEFKAVSGIGGACISSLSTFPVKEVMTRKERIKVMMMVKRVTRETYITATTDEDKKQSEEALKYVLSKMITG